MSSYSNSNKYRKKHTQNNKTLYLVISTVFVLFHSQWNIGKHSHAIFKTESQHPFIALYLKYGYGFGIGFNVKRIEPSSTPL